MATARKKVTKKSPAKKSRATSAPARTVSRAKTAPVTAASNRRFMQAKFTEQTIYWLIIGAAVIGLTVWVLSLQVRMDEMYDSMDAEAGSVVLPKKTAQ